VQLAVPAYAKLNLSLEVLGVLPDGYHDIRSTFQAISLHDLLLAEPAGETSLEGGFPDDLVLRAAAALERAVGRSLPARFRLVKRIPAGAGLGGGSSDAVAALRALSRLYELDVDLAPVAETLGADVPFFLRGGACEAAGRGERLRPLPLAAGWFALAWPGFEVPTGAVYRAWDRVGGDGYNHLLRAAMTVEPRLAAFAETLGPCWRVTGSGAGFFRHCRTRAEAEAPVAGLDCWTAVARPVGEWA
jgi:4-diphosphocytidyl-2-C-methyl-D-erythritol kinase